MDWRATRGAAAGVVHGSQSFCANVQRKKYVSLSPWPSFPAAALALLSVEQAARGRAQLVKPCLTWDNCGSSRRCPPTAARAFRYSRSRANFSPCHDLRLQLRSKEAFGPWPAFALWYTLATHYAFRAESQTPLGERVPSALPPGKCQRGMAFHRQYRHPPFLSMRKLCVCGTRGT